MLAIYTPCFNAAKSTAWSHGSLLPLMYSIC